MKGCHLKSVVSIATTACLGACLSAPAHVVVTVKDPLGLAEDASSIAFGRKLDSLTLVRTTGVEEQGERAKARPRAPTVLRGHLFLSGDSEAHLLDAAGRLKAVLHPGDNDIRHVEPGVCFVRQGNRTVKLVVQR